MNKKTKILVIILFTLSTISVLVAYNKYIIEEEFNIFLTEEDKDLPYIYLD